MACKVLCVLALVAAASAAPNSRLMGGTEMEVQSAPFVVSIQYTYTGPGITIQRCVGSLISSWHIVTTTFCFNSAILQNMRLQAGSTNSMQGGVHRAVTHFVPHPDYAASPRTNDVAVLFAAEPFGITANINVLYLPPSTFEIPVGVNIQIVGWGFDGPTGIQMQSLKYVNMQTISQDACRQAFSDGSFHITDNSICAAAPGAGLCMGDSGAPAFIDSVLVGVSSSSSCGDGNPDVFANIPKVTSWILSVATAPSSEGVPVRVAV